ncbi:MAG: response regulator [Firmicutes bacterium]|nr:response regulator [Bacillota bacterium]
MNEFSNNLVKSNKKTKEIIEISALYPSAYEEVMYLLIFHNEMVLIGLNPTISSVSLIQEIEQYGLISFLKTIIIQEMNFLVLSKLSELSQQGVSARIVTNESIQDIESSNILKSSFYSISSLNFELSFDQNRMLSFISAPFITSPHSFLVYEPQNKILFSNSLFDRVRPSLKNDDILTDLIMFHKNNVPSSNFLHPLVSKISKLNLNSVYTKSGYFYDSDEIKTAINTLLKLDFYNNNRFSSDESLDTNSINYISLTNQVIHKLRSLFGSIEIEEIFKNSDIDFDVETFEVKSILFEDYKLWQKIFELIYLKKGNSWLSVLEPMIMTFNHLYGVELPNIYHSEIIDNNKKIEELSSIKTKLESELKALEFNLQTTMDKLIKDPLTGTYNELFLKEYLLNELLTFDFESAQTREIILIYLTIDNLFEINSKYDQAIGDETISNTGYLLNQIRPKDELLFKRRGPGFVLYIHDASTIHLTDFTSSIQNRIKQSDVFIENITVSLAIVKLSEFYKEKKPDRIVELMLSTGENRIKLVYQKGPNSVIDDKTSIKKGSRGNILIVDYEKINLEIIKSFFQNLNYEIYTAVDGLEAFEIAKSKQIDVMIVERNIPKMDGLTLKQNLNESTFPMNILYFLLTYNKTIDTITRANQVGVDFVIEKPIVFEEILGIISREMKMRGIK